MSINNRRGAGSGNSEANVMSPRTPGAWSRWRRRLLWLGALAAALALVGVGLAGPTRLALKRVSGDEYYRKQNYEHAIAEYSEVLKVYPTYTTALYNRALAYTANKDYDHAIADYTEVIRLNPKDPDAFGGRGVAYDNKGDYERAIGNYNEAIRLAPNEIRPFYNRGLAYAHKQELDSALADFSEAIRLGAAYRAKGDGTAKEHADAFYNRGVAYDRKQDYERAIADFNEAVRLHAKHALALYARGLTRLHMGDQTAGYADIAAACEIEPNLSSLLLELEDQH